MRLFFGLWFIIIFFTTWLVIFFTSLHEWKKRGHEPKTLYEQAVSIILSGVMALAIALSINAVVTFIEYLPDGTDLTGDNTDKNNTRLNVFKNVSPGSNTFNEFSAFFTTPVTIMLGFLAILFIVKIETERLQNERRHNRKKAEDNLSDTAHYGIELLRDFDALHIDFCITKEELEKKYRIGIDTKELSREPDFESLLIIKNEEQYLSQELIKKLYFMSVSGQLRYKKLFTDEGLIACKNGEDIVMPETLRKIYYSSVATIFAEHVKRKMTADYSDIGDDVSKIQSLLEEVFLKTDFDIKNPNNKAIVKIFLKIEHGVRDFYDVQSGIFVQKKTTAQENKNNRLNDKQAQNILEIQAQKQSGTKIAKEVGNSSFAEMSEKTNIIDPFKAFNKSSLVVKTVNDFEKIERLLALLYDNTQNLIKKGALLHKIMQIYKDIKENYRTDAYILSKGVHECELNDFIDFYKALKKTHKNQFGKLFGKMVFEDKAVLTTQNKNAHKAERCINVFIMIWRECQAYYNYFDLFRNLHELKDALHHNKEQIGKESTIWALSFDKSVQLAEDEKYYQLELEWFNNANICDYYELLQMYFKQHKYSASKKMYDELFGDKGVLKNIDEKEYELFLQALLAHLRDNYIEEVEFKSYQEALSGLTKTASALY